MKNLFKILLIVICLATIAVWNPFKITDPNSPLFDPMKFSFRDYGIKEELDIFRKLFPIGTEKEFIDRVLVDAGNANMYQNPDNQNIWHYAPPEIIVKGMGRAPYMIIYDNNKRLLNIQSPSTAQYAYTDQVKYKKGIIQK